MDTRLFLDRHSAQPTGSHVFQCWPGRRVALQHLPQHVLCVWRGAHALEQGRISFEGQRCVPQQHAHHLSLVHLLMEQTLACMSAPTNEDFCKLHVTHGSMCTAMCSTDCLLWLVTDPQCMQPAMLTCRGRRKHGTPKHVHLQALSKGTEAVAVKQCVVENKRVSPLDQEVVLTPLDQAGMHLILCLQGSEQCGQERA